VIALQRQLSLVASEKDDEKDAIENSGLAMVGDTSPSSHQLRKRNVTSLSSVKSVDDRAAGAAEKKPLVSNQLIKEEDIEVGAVCFVPINYSNSGQLQCAKIGFDLELRTKIDTHVTMYLENLKRQAG